MAWGTLLCLQSVLPSCLSAQGHPLHCLPWAKLGLVSCPLRMWGMGGVRGGDRELRHPQARERKERWVRPIALPALPPHRE